MKNLSDVYNQKLSDLKRVHGEIEALRFVIPLLEEETDRVEDVALAELRQTIGQYIEGRKSRMLEDPRRS